jgi:tRNA-dihydrouridine synthase B
MLKVGNIELEKPLLLAPMEDVTNPGFRKICRELGADIVYTEFVNSDGLSRKDKKTHEKMKISDDERPIGIQIYGGNIEPMVVSAKIAEKEKPDLLDINAGCWVKKVANRGAGAGLLKDPPYMEKMVRSIVEAVDLPVTVKTRLGWDENSIVILDVARRIEDAGAKLLTVHCRTRSQGHSGEPAWFWINKIKEVVSIPVVLNGGVMTAQDVKRAFDETNADGVMIARGAIGQPWIFREGKEILKYGEVKNPVTTEERIRTALKHLKYEVEVKGERRAVIPFRKFYSGYLKGLHGASKIRQQLMQFTEYAPIEDLLLKYLEQLEEYEKGKPKRES